MHSGRLESGAASLSFKGFAGAVATLSIVSHVSASLVLDCLLISMCVFGCGSTLLFLLSPRSPQDNVDGSLVAHT